MYHVLCSARLGIVRYIYRYFTFRPFFHYPQCCHLRCPSFAFTHFIGGVKIGRRDRSEKSSPLGVPGGEGASKRGTDNKGTAPGGGDDVRAYRRSTKGGPAVSASRTATLAHHSF